MFFGKISRSEWVKQYENDKQPSLICSIFKTNLYLKTKGWTKLVLRLTHSVSSKCWFPADVIDLTKDKDDDLEKAIALSLQEAQVHQLWVGNLSAKSWNVVFHFKFLHWALFWHRKRNTYSSLFVKTRGIKIIHLYLHVLPSLTSDCHCKMPKFSGQSLILVVGASCKWPRPRLMVTTHVMIFVLFEGCATYLGAVLFNISVPWCDTNSVGGGRRGGGVLSGSLEDSSLSSK